MVSQDQIQSLQGEGVVVDQNGEKIGKVGQVYLDDTSGEPAWVTVTTGLFGTSESFVPLQGASVQDGEVRVAHNVDMVKNAPRVEADGSITPEEERELFAYYDANNLTNRAQGQDQGVPTGREEMVGQERAGGEGIGDAGRDDAREGADMIRSEEQVQVGTERVATGKARLRKYVVTENVTTTVPVQREEVRIEREPITDGDASMGESELGEDEQEVTLSEDRVVVDKEIVPVEKVRLDTDTVTEERQVSEEVRMEQIDTDLPDGESRQGHTGR